VSERIIRELTAKASWGQIFSRASSPSTLAPNGPSVTRPDSRSYGPQPDVNGGEVSGRREGQGTGPSYTDSSSWSAQLPNGSAWDGPERGLPFGEASTLSELDDILGSSMRGIPDAWDPVRFGPGASYATNGGAGGNNDMMGDSAGNGSSGAGGINDILAALGMGQEPQATFDSFFLHPLPDFPSDDWAV